MLNRDTQNLNSPWSWGRGASAPWTCPQTPRHASQVWWQWKLGADKERMVYIGIRTPRRWDCWHAFFHEHHWETTVRASDQFMFSAEKEQSWQCRKGDAVRCRTLKSTYWKQWWKQEEWVKRCSHQREQDAHHRTEAAEKEHRAGEKVERTGDGCRAAWRLTAEELEDPLVLWDTGWATAGEDTQIQGRQKFWFSPELGPGGLVYAERNRGHKALPCWGWIPQTLGAWTGFNTENDWSWELERKPVYCQPH